MTKTKTSEWTYDEFCEWAMEVLIDAVITGGFKELRSVFKYRIMAVLHNVYTNGGWRPKE
jgi:hypothetical protein